MEIMEGTYRKEDGKTSLVIARVSGNEHRATCDAEGWTTTGILSRDGRVLNGVFVYNDGSVGFHLITGDGNGNLTIRGGYGLEMEWETHWRKEGANVEGMGIMEVPKAEEETVMEKIDDPTPLWRPPWEGSTHSSLLTEDTLSDGMEE